MFIDTMNPRTRAPEERNVSGVVRPNCISLRWSEEKSFGRLAFYKHLAPNGAVEPTRWKLFFITNFFGKEAREVFLFGCAKF
jgi:hypothetical protein